MLWCCCQIWGVVTLPVSAGSRWLRQCRCLENIQHVQTCFKHKTRKKALEPDWQDWVSRNLYCQFLLMFPSRQTNNVLDKDQGLEMTTSKIDWTWTNVDEGWILYLLKLKIVISFQAKKHHHINCWIKSSLGHHELFSLYRREGERQYIIAVWKCNWLSYRPE